jgi:hypothetical protein
MAQAKVDVVAYEGGRLDDTANVLARAFETDPVFSWVFLPCPALQCPVNFYSFLFELIFLHACVQLTSHLGSAGRMTALHEIMVRTYF